LIHISAAVLDEGTEGQADGIAADAEGDRLRSRIDTPARAQFEAAAEIEDPRIRVNFEAATEAGER
jgi:hypothetical protein